MNKLANEKSPYLLQHKDNPVNWYPWGQEAFKLAKNENKPIFLSIGYSTCYWCHVMEKDSFEKEDVAELLNQHFIAIKVDREERPDVDQIYMDTVVGLTGHGGWPMSVFLTPELKPFWGGTFFYRKQFLSILQQIGMAWKGDRQPIEETAEKIRFHLSENQKPKTLVSLSQESITAISEIYRNNYDPEYGGFGTAPKFPPAMQLSYLLRNIYKMPNSENSEMITHTLNCMAKGGLYDHLKGGFHRYAVDAKWLVPHFEKMLYDNALLSLIYLEASQFFKDENYLSIACDTLDYLISDMTSPEGGFYAAEDAGDVDKEGEFYVWDYEELEKTLRSEDFAALKEVFVIEKAGNFEHGKIILSIPLTTALSERNKPSVRSARKDLLNLREKRKRPHRDDKIITSWCALAITSFAKAYLITGQKKYLEAAENCSKFISKNLYDGKILYRHFCSGRSEIPAFLEDYSFFIESLLNLYQATSKTKYYSLAIEIQKKQNELFWDEDNGAYFTSTAEELFLRKKEFSDSAIPSGNSVAMQNLITLSNLTHEEAWQEKIDSLIQNFSPYLMKYPSAFPRFLQAMQSYFFGFSQLVIAGKNKSLCEKDLLKASNNFLPFNLSFMKFTEEENQPKLLDGKNANDKSLYYLCRNFTCLTPKSHLEEVLKELQNS